MKKAIILVISLLFSINTYAFWIWSPKTQKWKNPRYSALATPFLQYKEAMKYYERGDYELAYKEFKKLLVNYPDSKEAADSQYYEGRCLEEMNKPYPAFLAYQKVIDSYPNSKRINEIVERQYKIGEFFLNREPKSWLGMSWYDFVDHPAVEIFKKIVETVPYSTYAPLAQYKLGMLLLKIGRYDESRDAFQKVIDNYPESEWAEPAKYQLAIATAKASPGVGYDSSYIEEATERLKEFVKEHPEAEISEQAEAQLQELRNSEAKKNLEIAQFYEIQRQYRSAITYYKVVVNNFPDSDYYDEAREKLEELTLLLETGFTKKELEKERRRVLAEKRKIEEENIKKEKQRQLEEERQLRKDQEEAQKIEEEPEQDQEDPVDKQDSLEESPEKESQNNKGYLVTNSGDEDQ